MRSVFSSTLAQSPAAAAATKPLRLSETKLTNSRRRHSSSLIMHQVRPEGAKGPRSIPDDRGSDGSRSLSTDGWVRGAERPGRERPWQWHSGGVASLNHGHPPRIPVPCFRCRAQQADHAGSNPAPSRRSDETASGSAGHSASTPRQNSAAAARSPRASARTARLRRVRWP